MESSTMRSNLGLGVVLTSAILACVGETSLFAQQPNTQPSTVSTSVPNIQAPGAAAVTNPSNVIQQGAGGAGGAIRIRELFWEFGGSAGRDHDDSFERHDQLLLLPRAKRRHVWHDRAGNLLLLHHRVDPGVHRSRADVLHAGSSRLPVRSVPSPICAADDADLLHDHGHHDDTDLLLHEPRLLLYADDVLHGPGRDDTRGHNGSGLHAHDLQCSE